jgi:hypothetical protein
MCCWREAESERFTVLVFEAKKKSAVIGICRILKFIMMITVINKE